MYFRIIFFQIVSINLLAFYKDGIEFIAHSDNKWHCNYIKTSNP